MTRPARTEAEVNAVKERILETALQIVIEEGFENLSMRKIASRLGITATTIYNYYTSKDELYFAIRIHGFQMVAQMFEEAYEEHDEPHERARAMLERQIRFGIEYPDYYDVMFVNRHVPRYFGCVGTELEAIAAREKEIALQPLYIYARVLKEMYADVADFTDEEARYLFIQLWCDTNGIISLHNSRMLHEVEQDVEGLIRRLTDDLYARFREYTEVWLGRRPGPKASERG